MLYSKKLFFFLSKKTDLGKHKQLFLVHHDQPTNYSTVQYPAVGVDRLSSKTIHDNLAQKRFLLAINIILTAGRVLIRNINTPLNWTIFCNAPSQGTD